MVNMIPVSSSNLAEIGYDENAQNLYVRFHDGSLYVYSNVPGGEFEGLLYASSKGKYLHQNIMGMYPYMRIE